MVDTVSRLDQAERTDGSKKKAHMPCSNQIRDACSLVIWCCVVVLVLISEQTPAQYACKLLEELMNYDMSNIL